MDASVQRCVLLIFLTLLGVKSKITHKATLDVVPATKDDTAVLQCYTYGSYPFPWPYITENKYNKNNYTTVWKKDDQVLVSDARLDISSKVTYNFCDTFPGSAKHYFEATGMEATGKLIDGYDRDKGFACLVSTLTIKKVQESDYGTYQCNYSDFYEEAWKKLEHPANVTLVKTSDYTSEPKVKLVQSNNALNTVNVTEYSYGTYGIPTGDKLAQCISIDTPLDWYYVLGASLRDVSDCYAIYTDEVRQECLFANRAKKISSMNSDDFFRCFDVTSTTHDPQVKGIKVYESFILFKRFCVLDEIHVFCGSADKKIGDTNNSVRWGTSMEVPWNYDFEYYIHITTGVGIGVVGCLLLAASIVACSRISCNYRRISS